MQQSYLAKREAGGAKAALYVGINLSCMYVYESIFANNPISFSGYQGPYSIELA